MTPRDLRFRRENADPELQMLVLFSLPAERDRIRDGVTERQCGPQSKMPARRTPKQQKIAVRNAAQRFGAVMDVDIRRNESLTGQCRILQALSFYVVREAQRHRDSGAQSVGGAQLGMKQCQAYVMLVVGD